jgi:hypothetical protein
VARAQDGARVFMLAQSHMPAQDIHILKDPATGEAWFNTAPGEPLIAPEWSFLLIRCGGSASLE